MKGFEMSHTSLKKLVIAGATAGVVAVLSYFMAVFVPLPDSMVFLLAMLFPAGLTIFFFSLKEYISFTSPNYWNNLFFIFSCFAAITAAVMLAAQMGVQTMITAPQANSLLIKQSLRSIDLGIDVAWDFFISTAMILLLPATFKIKFLRWWGVTNALLGIILLVFNLISYPLPPNEKGLIDMGPFIALFWIVLQLRMMYAGIKLVAVKDISERNRIVAS